MSAPPIRRTKKPAPKKEEGNPALNVLIVVVGVCVVGLLLAIWPESTPAGSYGGSPNSALEAFFKSKGVTFNGARVLCSDKCRLVTTRPVQQGEALIQIPQQAIVDPRSINETNAGKACFADDAAILNEFVKKENLGVSFANLFQYAFYFALEKRDSYSDIAGWLSALPQSAEEMPSALNWDETMDDCVDQHVANEAKAVRGILTAAVDAAAQLCELPDNKALCGGNPPTEAELKWALSVYLHSNFQDQAILLGANFAKLSNARGGMNPQFDQERGALNMISGDNYKKGEAVVINFARGPGTLLVSQGTFDPASAGIDARIRIPDTSKDPLAKKFCADKYAELIFGHNGQPRDALVNCIGLMVADKSQRKGFAKNIKKDRELRMYTFGNLTGLLQNTQKQLTETIMSAGKNSQCNRDASPLAAQMAEYREFAHNVVNKNMDFCAKTYYSFNPPPPPGTPQGAEEDGEIATGGSATITPEAEEAPMEDAPETP